MNFNYSFVRSSEMKAFTDFELTMQTVLCKERQPLVFVCLITCFHLIYDQHNPEVSIIFLIL